MSKLNGDNKLLFLYMYIPAEWPYGSVRRRAIVAMFESNPGAMYSVNCKYRPQMKNDPDLRRLVKRGYLKTIRLSTGGKYSRRTYLVKA